MREPPHKNTTFPCAGSLTGYLNCQTALRSQVDPDSTRRNISDSGLQALHLRLLPLVSRLLSKMEKPLVPRDETEHEIDPEGILDAPDSPVSTAASQANATSLTRRVTPVRRTPLTQTTKT
jgi:hypothetical protein